MTTLSINLCSQDKTYGWPDVKLVNHQSPIPEVRALFLEGDELIERANILRDMACAHYDQGVITHEEWYIAHEVANALLKQADEKQQMARDLEDAYYQKVKEHDEIQYGKFAMTDEGLP